MIKMAKLVLFVGYYVLAFSIFYCSAPQSIDKEWTAIRKYPPLVFSSEAYLECSISNSEEGRQKVTTVSGQGFTFDAPMLPIKEGKVKIDDDNAMHYSFNAFPPYQIPAHFSGLGDGTITELMVEVEVKVDKWEQPDGSGTKIYFESIDINNDSAYVEMTGVFIRGRDNKPFPFRLLFLNAGMGNGEIIPSGPRREEELIAKTVIIGNMNQPAKVITSFYEEEADVYPLPEKGKD